ncbi:MAG: TOMM precursor leader peptide-binding protein, partial [Sciscionella sp.]
AVRAAPRPGCRDPDLVILADSAVPAPEVVAGLTARATPHLLVRTREGAGWVGPFVHPGRTSCLHCLDCHRTDRDESWPLLAAQLISTPSPVDLACAQATAAFAAGQALHAIAGAQKLLLYDSVAVVDVFAASAVRRTWPAHPRCGCVPPPTEPAAPPGEVGSPTGASPPGPHREKGPL